MKKQPTCAFNFRIPADPAAIIGMVRPMIVDAGGTVVGDNADITFSIPTVVGRFDGACKVLEPTLVNITVTERPDVISCKMIQKQLTVYITEAVKMYNKQSKAAAAVNGKAAADAATDEEVSDGRSNGA